MFEVLRNKKVALGAVVLGIGSSAVGYTVAEAGVFKTTEPSVEALYRANGSRVMDVDVPGISRGTQRILAFCDGRDLIETTAPLSEDAGASILRSVGHRACMDGMLKPADFPKTPAVSVEIEK